MTVVHAHFIWSHLCTCVARQALSALARPAAAAAGASKGYLMLHCTAVAHCICGVIKSTKGSSRLSDTSPLMLQPVLPARGFAPRQSRAATNPTATWHVAPSPPCQPAHVAVACASCPAIALLTLHLLPLPTIPLSPCPLQVDAQAGGVTQQPGCSKGQPPAAPGSTQQQQQQG